MFSSYLKSLFLRGPPSGCEKGKPVAELADESSHTLIRAPPVPPPGFALAPL
jgi:hypothetical protein